jgi:hypothetical protein
MALCVRPHSTAESGEGLATRGQDGPEPPHEAPGRRWGGKSRLTRTQYWPSNIWYPDALTLSWLR